MTTEYNFLESDQQWLQRQVDALSFASVFKSWRQTEELTQQDLAEKLGVSKQYISALERGQRQPSLKEALRFGEVFEAGDLFALQLLKDQIKEAALPYELVKKAV